VVEQRGSLHGVKKKRERITLITKSLPQRLLKNSSVEQSIHDLKDLTSVYYCIADQDFNTLAFGTFWIQIITVYPWSPKENTHLMMQNALS
jgi:hypothetical protein